MARIAGRNGMLYVGIGTGSSAVHVAVADGRGLGRGEVKAATAEFEKQLLEQVHRAGYPARADPATFNAAIVLAICLYLCVINAMTYGPLAASTSFPHAFVIHRSRCRTTSPTAGLAGSCRSHRSRSLRRPATSTPGSGIQS